MIFTRSHDAPDVQGDGITFRLSTPGQKRDGLELDMSRFQLADFRANPVMLWMHGMDANRGSLPIGRWEGVTAAGDGIRATAVFDDADGFARDVRSKYERGFLNAVSIGWHPTRDARGAVEGYDLLEASAVAVPADPSALAEGRSVVLTTEEYAGLRGRLDSLEESILAARRGVWALGLQGVL
jgi:hypothetical protein